jgi:hypothetical protein
MIYSSGHENEGKRGENTHMLLNVHEPIAHVVGQNTDGKRCRSHSSAAMPPGSARPGSLSVHPEGEGPKRKPTPGPTV